MLPETPTVAELSQVMIHATAPAFILGAQASFISLVIARMNGIIERTRMINMIPDSDERRRQLREDLPRLKHRTVLLHRSVRYAIFSAIVTTVLICLAFAMAFIGQQHEFGGALLFIVSLVLFGISLVFLSREVSIGLTEFDHIG